MTSLSANVDVVVVSYNSRDSLRDCVDEISRREEINVIVVDNASGNGCIDTIRDLDVTLVEEKANRGFAYGCNVGWRLGQAPYVLFLNPDAKLDNGAIETLVGVLESDDRIGIAGPRIINSDGSPAWSQRYFPSLASTFSQALFLHHLFKRHSWSDEVISEPALYEEARDAEWLSGACLLVRRTVLKEIGGFDEGFFMYSEDMELCRATWAGGYRVRYEPKAVVAHAAGSSAPRSSLLAELARSRVRYAQMNYPGAVARGHQLGIALEALTHSVVTRGGSAVRRGFLQAFQAALAGPEARPASVAASETGDVKPGDDGK